MHVPRRQVQEEEELPPEEGGHGCRKGKENNISNISLMLDTAWELPVYYYSS